MAMYDVTKRLYYTRDRRRVVEEGDPAAAFLFATPGTSVPLEEAERVGLTGKKVAAPAPVVVPSVAADPEPAPKPEAPAPEPAPAKPATKAVHDAPEDKALPAPQSQRRS